MENLFTTDNSGLFWPCSSLSNHKGLSWSKIRKDFCRQVESSFYEDEKCSDLIRVFLFMLIIMLFNPFLHNDTF